ncbi:TonB-dependent receptor [Sphingomonas sp. HF-S4]|uniref:TonB-dependent receptor n=1 Tax=Sphingomonas agrestis TaxID=3080540 RepID=A0ABU3YBL1_9SPHN|nr:TonB-dependent receptor [Sphingomonas sp. HF-S4]MDV3458779.1 TonB-dependent receptor [Sphingomonas sp. HF-S4]
MCLALLLPVPALAQADPDEIVVTGRGLDAPPGEAAYAVVTIDRERLAGTASGRLEDALRDAAGLAQFRRSDSRSAHPTSQGITLRGLGGNASSRALLLLDGVPQADPFGGWVAFSAYLPDRLAAARITRGGGSGYAGPGALAGTIELSSASPADLGPLQLRASYGSRDSIDAVALASAQAGGGFVTLASQVGRGDGFTPVIARQRGPIDRPAAYRQGSLALRSVFDVGAGTELQANVSGFTDRRDRGVDFTPVRSDGADASLRLVHRGDWGWSALGYVQMRQFASGFSGGIDAGRTVVGPSLDQFNVPATGIGARVEVQPPVGGGVTLRLGADARHVSGRTRERYFFTGLVPGNLREAGGTNLTAGGFADASYEAGALTLSLSGRVDRWTIRDGFLRQQSIASGALLAGSEAYGDRSGWEATGRGGLALRATEAVSLRAAAYRGWRLPTLNELYRPFRVGNDTTNANAALAPERLTGVEAGIDLTPTTAVTVRTTLFWNRLEDAIGNVTLSSTPSAATRQRRNLDAVEARGVEVDARYAAGAFSLAASYAYTDARVEDDAGTFSLDSLHPAQTARHQASATAAWRRGDAGVSLTARYTGPQYEDDQNSRELAEALTVDATAALPLGRSLAVEARAENLADARVEAGISGPGVIERATPRTLWLGLRYRIR